MYKVWIAAFSLLTTPGAYAAEWSLTGALNPTAEYNDNVQMSEDEQGSMHYKVTPTINLARKLENSTLSMSAGYEIDRYTSISDIDTENPFLRFNGLYNTEKSQYGLTANHIKRTSRFSAENDTGDFATQSIETTKTISPSYSYQLDERDSVSLNGEFTKREFSTVDFSDSELILIRTGWQRKFSERFDSSLDFTISNYKSKGEISKTENDNYNLSVYLGYAWSEIWNVNGRIGVRRLESEQSNSFGFSESNSNSGSSFNFNATRNNELGQLALSLSRELSPSSSGDVNEQDRINISWSHRLTETLSANIVGNYQETTSAINEGTDKRENITIHPSLTWQVLQDIGFNFSYRYRQQKSDSGTNVDSNSIMFTLNYDWEGFRASR